MHSHVLCRYVLNSSKKYMHIIEYQRILFFSGQRRRGPWVSKLASLHPHLPLLLSTWSELIRVLSIQSRIVALLWCFALEMMWRPSFTQARDTLRLLLAAYLSARWICDRLVPLLRNLLLLDFFHATQKTKDVTQAHFDLKSFYLVIWNKSKNPKSSMALSASEVSVPSQYFSQYTLLSGCWQRPSCSHFCEYGKFSQNSS